jgi:hypothetical protein
MAAVLKAEEEAQLTCCERASAGGSERLVRCEEKQEFVPRFVGCT